MAIPFRAGSVPARRPLGAAVKSSMRLDGDHGHRADRKAGPGGALQIARSYAARAGGRARIRATRQRRAGGVRSVVASTISTSAAKTCGVSTGVPWI